MMKKFPERKSEQTMSRDSSCPDTFTFCIEYIVCVGSSVITGLWGNCDKWRHYNGMWAMTSLPEGKSAHPTRVLNLRLRGKHNRNTKEPNLLVWQSERKLNTWIKWWTSPGWNIVGKHLSYYKYTITIISHIGLVDFRDFNAEMWRIVPLIPQEISH